MPKADTKLNFTKRALEALTVPQGKRVYYQDARTPGLSICITPAGCKSFYVVKWVKGRGKTRIPLGRFGEITVEQAQKQAKALVGEIAKGNDPAAARQAARHEQTISGLFNYWLEDAKARGVKTWGEEEKRYNRYLKPWRNRQLSSVKKSDVQTLFAQVTTKSGRYAGNKLLGLLKAMYHKALDMGFSGADPTAGVKKHKEEKRKRFIRASELKCFFQAVFSEPNETLRDLLLVMLLTAARKSNVMAMAWVDIDFTTQQWTIPTTKSGESVTVPLSPPAMAILNTRHKANGSSPWVFPSNRGTSGHITEVKSAWKRIITAANLGNCRPHDLRRSLASHMAIAGSSLLTIGAMLGHSQPSSTAIYARLDDDPVRTAAETATTSIMEAGGVKLLEGNLIIDVPATAVDAAAPATDPAYR